MFTCRFLDATCNDIERCASSRPTSIACSRARQDGLRILTLTCKPSRVAARHIYRSLGFIQVETGSFRLDL